MNESKLITAFDMDGVIVSDINMDYNNPEQLEKIKQIRMVCEPIFRPHGTFVIITGRPENEHDQTWQWLEMYNVKPQRVFFKPEQYDFSKQSIIDHKARTIRELNRTLYYGYVTKFVESDKTQVEGISKQVDIPVIHFPVFSSNALVHAGWWY